MDKKIIEEVIIKKKKDQIKKDNLNKKIKNDLLKKKIKRTNKEEEQYLTAQKIVKNYREKQKSHAYFNRKINQPVLKREYDPQNDNKPIVLIRISGQWDRISKETKEILTKLKLKKLFSAIVLRYNKETVGMIRLIEPYVTWGLVDKNMIKDLIYKRGSVKTGDNEVVEIDNTIIETSLGKIGIFVIEDLVDELFKCGKHMNDVMNFIGFFLLTPTQDVKERINIPFVRGGNQGYRGTEINKLLKEMI